jgi:hypothetical protein
MSQQLRNGVRRPIKTKHVMVKMSPEEFAIIMGKSRRWAKGNISGFLREAGKIWVPDKDQLVEVESEDDAS